MFLVQSEKGVMDCFSRNISTPTPPPPQKVNKKVNKYVNSLRDKLPPPCGLAGCTGGATSPAVFWSSKTVSTTKIGSSCTGPRFVKTGKRILSLSSFFQIGCQTKPYCTRAGRAFAKTIFGILYLLPFCFWWAALHDKKVHFL